MSKTQWSQNLPTSKGQRCFLRRVQSHVNLSVATPKTIPMCPKQASKCTKCVLIYLHCQSEWKLPGCGFNWEPNLFLAVWIYYSYTSPSGFHLGDKSFRWWMRQYLYIMLQSKQGDFQFSSSIRLLLEFSNKDSDLGGKYTQLNIKNNFLKLRFLHMLYRSEYTFQFR